MPKTYRCDVGNLCKAANKKALSPSHHTPLNSPASHPRRGRSRGRLESGVRTVRHNAGARDARGERRENRRNVRENKRENRGVQREDRRNVRGLDLRKRHSQ